MFSGCGGALYFCRWWVLCLAFLSKCGLLTVLSVFVVFRFWLGRITVVCV